MLYEIRHTVRQTFSAPAALEPMLVRLRPRTDCTQRTVFFDLRVTPTAAAITEGIGLEGNTAITLWFEGPTDGVTLEALSIVETLRDNPFDFLISNPRGLNLPVSYPPPFGEGLAHHRHPIAPSGLVADFTQASVREANSQTVPFLKVLAQRIARTVVHEHHPEGTSPSAEETLRRARGGGHDRALLFVECCRSVSLAARFVSGYADSEVVRDSSCLHAWAEVFLPGSGWRGFDPSAGVTVADRHVALAAGISPAGGAPIEGNIRAEGVTSQVTSDVRIVVRDPTLLNLSALPRERP